MIIKEHKTTITGNNNNSTISMWKVNRSSANGSICIPEIKTGSVSSNTITYLIDFNKK